MANKDEKQHVPYPVPEQWAGVRGLCAQYLSGDLYGFVEIEDYTFGNKSR